MNEKRETDTGSGISPVGPSNKVKAAIRKAVKRIADTPDPESSRLRRSLASKFRIPEEGFVFGNSIKELVHLIIGVVRPKRVLVIGSSRSIYRDAYAAAGAEVSYLYGTEESGFAVDMETTRQRVEGIDLIFIANPDRITGRLMNKMDMEEFLRFTADKKTTVVLDESLIEFTEDEGQLRYASMSKHIIVLRTTAFFFGLPGLELAYAVTSPSVQSVLHRRKCSDINTLAQEAARAALKDKTYIKLSKKYVHDEKTLLAKALGKIRGVTFHGSDSNMFLIKAEGFEREMAQALTRAGFLIKDCGDVQGLGPHFFRMSVMEHDKNKKFVRLLKEVMGDKTGAQVHG